MRITPTIPLKGVGAFGRKGLTHVFDPRARAEAARRYTNARQELDGFVRVLNVFVDDLPGLRVPERNRLMNLARRIYGLARRHRRKLLLVHTARAGGEWLRRACDPGRVLLVVKHALELRGVTLTGQEQAQLASDLDDYRRGMIPETERLIAASAPRLRRRFLRLSVDELTDRVREYFARYLDPHTAESATEELVWKLLERRVSALSP